MKKIKVLHVLNSNSYSGAENVVISIIDNLKDRIDGIYLSPKGPIEEQLKLYHITYYGVNVLNRQTLKKAVEELKPDVIHAHDFRAGIWSASLKCKIPIINHLHNNSPWLKTFSLNSVVYALSTLRYKKILTVSESVMHEFIFSNICRKKLEVIGNPIDIKKIVEKVKNKNICEPYEIAFLGRLSTPKNPLFFLDIIFEIKKQIPHVQACMIGDGELREQVEDKIQELNLSDNVKLLGFQSNPYEYLYQAKVLCMPSIWEGFGLAAVEALALGKPVVAAPVGGLVNIIDMSCGQLCKVKDEYVQTLYSLLKEDEKYNVKVNSALQRAKQLNNIQRYIENIYEVYKDSVKILNICNHSLSNDR